VLSQSATKKVSGSRQWWRSLADGRLKPAEVFFNARKSRLAAGRRRVDHGNMGAE